jgi:hypothetical protein
MYFLPRTYPVLPLLQHMIVFFPVWQGTPFLLTSGLLSIGGLLKLLSENDASPKLHVTIRLKFDFSTDSLWNILWSTWITDLTEFPTVRLPIELQIGGLKLRDKASTADVLSSMNKFSTMQTLVGDGKITITAMEE